MKIGSKRGCRLGRWVRIGAKRETTDVPRGEPDALDLVAVRRGSSLRLLNQETLQLIR